IFFRAPIAAIRPSRASKAPSQIISSSPSAFSRRGASPRTVTICPQSVTSRSRFACSRFCVVDIFLRTFTVLKTAALRKFRAPESCRWNFEHWRILRRTKMTLGEPMARKMFGIKLAVATAAALFVVLIAAGKFARAQNTIAKPSEYNIIIRNGHIIDGTGSPWYSGDIAIRDGRIAAIGDLSRARSKKTIDAAGRVVAPGFIDMLGQSETTILVDPHVPSKIFQGITTEITGEGDTVAPQNDSTLANLNTECRHYGITCDWRTFTEYFARLQKQGMGINLGTYVGATQVRRVVIGENDVQATPAQLDQMKSLVAEAMREGAMGLSSALEYPPAPYASTDELIALASVASQYGGIYATHMRNEGDGEMEALAETARIAREAHIPVEIFHLKTAGKPNWGKMPQVVAFIDKARSEGLDIEADTYAYTAWANGMSAFIPPWAHDGGNEKLIERLRNPQMRARIRKEMLTPSKSWDNEWQEIAGPEGVLLCELHNPVL